jgi:hypothetical protein
VGKKGNFMRKILILALLLLTGCGQEMTSLKGDTGAQGAAGTAGSQGLQGASGVSGLTVSTSKAIQRSGPDIYTGASGTSLCPGYPTTDTCSFEGGQLITYSDGTVFLSGSFRMIRQDTYSFYNESSYSKVFAPGVSSGDIVLTTRLYQVPNNPRILFIHWERSPELVQLIVDSNQSQTVNSGDSVLQSLTLL